MNHLQAADDKPNQAEGVDGTAMARVHLQSAFALDRLGKEDEAVPLYERALSLGLCGTDARDAHVCLASSLRNMGRPQQGFDLLDSAKSRFNGDVVFDLFFALLATEIGRSSEAIGMLVRSLLRESPAEDLERYGSVLRGKFDDLLRASGTDTPHAACGASAPTGEGERR